MVQILTKILFVFVVLLFFLGGGEVVVIPLPSKMQYFLEFINALIEQANGSNKKSLFSKIFNQQKELPVEEVETKIEVIKNELNDIKIKSAKIKNIINAKKRRVLVLANVLSVIVENVTIEDDFLFSAIHDKNIFLLNCYTQLLNVDKLNQDLDNDVYILESKIKEAIDFTIPSIKLSRVALN